MRTRIKPRTVHKDRYGRSDTLDSVVRVNGRDLLDQSSALDNDILRRQREAAEYEAHVERQAVLTMVRAEVASRRAREADAEVDVDAMAEWALAEADNEEAAVGRIYAKDSEAGLVERRRNRRLGVTVSLYHASQGGIDDDPENPWATFCETHEQFVVHRSMPIARSFMAVPDEWCPCCADEAREDVA